MTAKQSYKTIFKPNSSGLHSIVPNAGTVFNVSIQLYLFYQDDCILSPMPAKKASNCRNMSLKKGMSVPIKLTVLGPQGLIKAYVLEEAITAGFRISNFSA